MKLSLVFQAYTREYGAYEKVAKSILPLPPLNLCLVASLAEKEGVRVQIIDAEIENLTTDDVIGRLKSFAPDVVGFTATTPFFPSVSKLAKTVKETLSIPIMVGGPHISIFREKAFYDWFDYLFIGESDLIIGEFIKQFKNNPEEIAIKGVVSRKKNREIYYSGLPPVPSNLDKVPYPARHYLKNDLYLFRTRNGARKCTMIQMTRGCPFECAYCATNLLTKNVRRRSIANVIKEIEYVVRDLGVEHIYFSDDNLTLSKEYMMELCGEIEKRNLKFTFEGHTRADLWDEEMAKKMRDCGLVRISFGLETAVPRMRKIIKKNVPLESYTLTNRINNKLGIETMNSVMLGLPGETRETIKETVDYLCKTRDIQNITYGITVPYPGTEIYKWAEKGMYGLKLLSRDFSKRNSDVPYFVADNSLAEKHWNWMPLKRIDEILMNILEWVVRNKGKKFADFDKKQVF